MTRTSTIVFLLLLVLAVLGDEADGQTTAFNYQGQLQNASASANGNFDFEFLLFDAPSGGSQVGATVTLNGVSVANGIFRVTLDFGSNFPGANRFLEIHVRQSGGGAFTTLLPRQPISSAPYALKSLNTDIATNAVQLGGVVANQYVQTTDTRLSDARDPSPGSSNYIQNGTSVQATSSFNISGNGTVGGTVSGNIVNAGTQFNINNARVLSNAGAGNLFAGVGAGTLTMGSNNSFFGSNAGSSNTTGSMNVFLGTAAGFQNINGSANTFLGNGAGNGNTSGNGNVFVGASAGQFNTLGLRNSFFGPNTGITNTQGSDNAAFGFSADLGSNGLTNATAIGAHALANLSNSIVLGSINGINGATADAKVGIGTTSPGTRLHVVGDSWLIGKVGIGTTAPGTNLHVVGDSWLMGKVGIGTNSPLAALHVAGDAFANGIVVAGASLTSQVALGTGVGSSAAEIKLSTLLQPFFSIYTSPGSNRLTVADTTPVSGLGAGGTPLMTILGASSGGNVGIGTSSPATRLHINGAQEGIRVQGLFAGAANMAYIVFADSNGAFTGSVGDTSGNDSSIALASNSGDVGLNTASGRVLTAASGGNVGIGTTTPSFRLHINGETRTNLLSIDNFVSNAGGPTLCASTSTNRVGLCSSSLRYKTNIGDYSTGFDTIKRLRPITFDWKENGMPDFGLAAEEVEKVDNQLVYYNKQNQVEGVKYDHLAVVLINAVKEQQAQIDSQKNQLSAQAKQIERQKAEMEDLRSLVCGTHKKAAVCRK